jgi:altronate dehydratase
MDPCEKRVQHSHPSDNVVTALADLPQGAVIQLADMPVVARTAIPFGHKMALTRIASGSAVIKYGEVIGVATADIAAGEHVHSHNLVTQRGHQRRSSDA